MSDTEPFSLPAPFPLPAPFSLPAPFALKLVSTDTAAEYSNAKRHCAGCVGVAFAEGTYPGDGPHFASEEERRSKFKQSHRAATPHPKKRSAPKFKSGIERVVKRLHPTIPEVDEEDEEDEKDDAMEGKPFDFLSLAVDGGEPLPGPSASLDRVPRGYSVDDYNVSDSPPLFGRFGSEPDDELALLL